ncbi:SDR family NAD(P)-dependent oxidoreductase, partial [Streptomyces durbertensis]
MSEMTEKTTLTVPRLGEGIVEVRVLRLLKRPGDVIAKDELLYEMEHDKAAVEIESPAAGRLHAWLVAEGDRVPVGGAVAELLPADAAGPAPEFGPARDTTEPAAGTHGPALGASPAGLPGMTPPGKLRVPPRTRAHARRLGLAESLLPSIPASGRSLLPADLERYVAARRSPGGGAEPRALRGDPSEQPEPRVEQPERDQAGDYRDVPVSPRQRQLNRALRAGAENVVSAVVAGEIPDEVLAGALGAHRAAGPDAAGFSTPFQVFAHTAARVAADFPRLRSRRLDEERVRVFDHVDLGIACATENGDLTVGVVRDADTLDAPGFDERYASAVEQALAGQNQADGRVTLVLSHLGDHGATFAVPVVVPPAAATLFLGAPDRVGRGAVRRMVLAFDHTVFNGREAALYLEALRAALVEAARTDESPAADRPEHTGASTACHTAPDPLTALTALAGRVVGHALDPDVPLGEQGFDSTRALRLVREVAATFGTKLPATAIWRHPTLRSLATLLPPPSGEERIPVADGKGADGKGADGKGADGKGADGYPVGQAAEDAAEQAEEDVAVAVVGMACRVPGAENVDEFWTLLTEGGCSIAPVTADRFAGAVPDGFRAGLLGRTDLFDARFFSVTPRQAASMDPQQRALLELSWHALEHAGLNPDALAGTPVGVFAAACSYDYREQLVDREAAADGYATVGTFPAFLANRISHTYDFTGPSITVDTACSGALTALSLAERAIRSGECEVVLAGAANLLSNGFNARAFQRAGMLSPHGDSRVFDERADGFVRGEGAGWVVLKSLTRALADGDPVLAVLRSTAVNHGGRAAALTSPNPRAQTALARTALDRAGLRVGDLGYLEAHGTGTPLGDPIELEAFRDVLAAEPNGVPASASGPEGRLWVGSVKANIGHLEGASGLAGLIKAVHTLRHGLIPATPNFTRLNPHIDLDGTPLRVADRAVEWPALPGSAPRRAAVSAFGFGGSNAHAVLEEPRAPASGLEGTGPAAGLGDTLVVPLSAATDSALRQLAAALARRLRKEPHDLRQVAWTLQSGRRALASRVVLLAREIGELAEQLALFAAEGAQSASATTDRPAALEQLADTATRRALTDWLSGGSIDWGALWLGGVTPRRVPLVPYPFQRESYWLPGGGAAGEEAAHTGPAHSPDEVDDATGTLQLVAGHPLGWHRVAGRAVAPGALLIDVLAGGGPVALRSVRFLTPAPFGSGLRLERRVEERDSRTVTTVLQDGHVRARATIDADAPPPLTPDRSALLDGRPVELADVLRRAGIDVGPAYRAVNGLRRAGDWAIGGLAPRPGDHRTRRVGWLDAALQAACALLPSDQPRMAAAVSRVWWTGELPDRADLVLRLVAQTAGHSLVDLDAVTPDGREVLRVRGLRLLPVPRHSGPDAPQLAGDRREEDAQPGPGGGHPGEHDQFRMWSPVWEAEPAPSPEPAPADQLHVVLYDPHSAPLGARLAADDRTVTFPVGPTGVDRGRLSEAVTGATGPLTVTLIVGGARWTEDHEGVSRLRHWLGALLTTAQVVAGAGAESRIRLLTTGLSAPDGGPVAPGAALQGALLGAVRTLPLELPAVSAAAVDLPVTVLDEPDAESAVAGLRAALAEPCGRTVPRLALRDGRRLREVFTERRAGRAPAEPNSGGFRAGGTYVLFGGAGGIGAEVARHLAVTYRASLLLVGRSPENDRTRQLLADLRAAGGRAHYHRGDVTDEASVATALAECRRTYGAPDGVLHSVGSVSDGLLTELTPGNVDEVLDSKVTAVLNLRRALRGRPGTSLVLFSSVAGLFGSVGGLNYAAANAFLDHYAAAVDGDGGLVARSFTWGLWRGTGLARRYSAHVRRQYPGLTDFEAERGVAALEAGMSGTDPQTVAVSGTPTVLRELTRPPRAGDPAHRLEEYARGALAARMAALGLDRATALAGPDAAAERLGVVPEHRRLLTAALELLDIEGGAVPPAGELDRQRAELVADHPDLRGHLDLVDLALSAYGPVLRGERSATDVLFPGGSLDTVAAVYSGNQLFDPVNRAVAEEAAAGALEITGAGRRPRLLEIGSGVGGTTAAVLAAMDRQGVVDAEYTYTDVSRAFLQHGRRRFGDRVTPRLLDIEKDPSGQGFAEGGYDLVVASNVLHATRDLTSTLRHVGRLLAPGGRLLLVEITAPAAVYTLTFGLTDGWWRYVDEQYRMPHGPLLDVGRWRSLLHASGWELTRVGHLRDAPGCVALLDCRPPAADAPRGDEPGVREPAGEDPRAGAPAGGDSAERLRAIVRGLLGDPAAEVPGGLPWQELGVDSLLNTELVNAVSAEFGRALSATTLFEYPNVDALAGLLDGGDRSADPATGARPGDVAATLAELLGMVADLTGQDASGVDPDTDFPSAGVDSLLNGEFTAMLRDRFPTAEVPSTVLFEYPTPRALARWLATRTSRPTADEPLATRRTPTAATRPLVTPSVVRIPDDAATVARQATGTRPPRHRGEQDHSRPLIAVVGLAGRYPGAENVDEFWRLLSEGRTPVREVPADRWDWRTARTLGGGYARWGCFLDGWDRFDPEFFRITPRDAALMDPQERLFLEVAWTAFESAGYTRRTLSGGADGPRVGVFAGVTANSNVIAQHQARLAGADNPEYAVSAAASVANRVSHALDLSGPSLTVDTMCSSSLTALHLACRSIREGEADLALAGGVNLYLHPDRFAGLCALGMPSRGDRTRAFGADGDGFVPGEGVGAVVLKRLDAAEADGDTILAVIRGTGLNHGGGASGYTVPSPTAQAALISRTLADAGVEPDSVDYVEAHGTGTELGDPIEARALALAFDDGRESDPARVLRIGSVKSNIGHGEAAAGVAGLTKALLQLRHGRLTPTLHVERQNPRLELAGTSLRIQRGGELWPRRTDAQGRPLPRRTAVSSFGAGGANAHVVLEEYRAPAQEPAEPAGPVLLPLSAPDPRRLRALARRLADTLDVTSGVETLLPGAVSPADVAHTLRTGRETWEHRAAVAVDVAVGAAEAGRRMVEALDALAEGRAHPDVTTAESTEHAPEGARRWVEDGAPPAPSYRGRRVPLPTTPFADVRCVPPRALPPSGTDRPVDLPLADSVRAPGARTVTAHLGGASRWVADHVVDGLPLLPGAFHPELVHEALLTAGESPYRCALRDLVWPAPAGGLPMTVSAELGEADRHGARRFRIDAETGGTTATVAEGWTEPREEDPVRPHVVYRPEDLARYLRADGTDSDAFYRLFAAQGFSYGPLFRTVRRARCEGDESTAELRLPEGEDRDGRQVLHPALLDGACQTAAFLLVAEEPAGRRRYRPLAIDRLVMLAPVTGAVHVHARRVRADESTGTHVFDLRLIDVTSGRTLAEIEGFRVRVEPREPEERIRHVVQPADHPADVVDGAAPRAPAVVASAQGVPDLAGYRLAWREAPLPEAGPPGPLWVVGDGRLADLGGTRLSLAEACDTAVLEETVRRTGAPATVLIDLTGPSAGLRFGDLPAGRADVAAGWSEFRAAALDGVFRPLRALVRCRSLDGARVLLVTEAEEEPPPAVRGLHSLVRTVAGETSRLRPAVLTLDARWRRARPEAAREAVLAEVGAAPADGQDWVRLRPGTREHVVVVPDPSSGGSGAEPTSLLVPGGSYLVVGGLGGLGRSIAEAVRAAQPTARLVLVGRSTPDEEALDWLRGLGPENAVAHHRCDITDPEQLDRLAAALAGSGTRLRGVFHVAGVLRDGFLRGKDLSDVEEVCRAKALGAVAVDAAFADHPLDFFVVASSLAALVGNQGQSDYAFANGFLDGFATARARWVREGRRNGRTLSVGWPVLAGAGMTPEPAAQRYLTDTYGLRPVPVADAVRELWSRLAAAAGPESAHVALFAGDQDVWCRALHVAAPAAAPTEP